MMTKELENFSFNMEKLIKNSDNIYIIGHNDPDFDALGAAVGMAEVCKVLGKDSKIIMNEDEFTLQPAVKLLKDILEKYYEFIDLEEYIDEIRATDKTIPHYSFAQLVEEDNNYFLKRKIIPKSLLIIVDTNNVHLLSNKEFLRNYSNILIVDHHEKIDDQRLKRATSIIDTSYSSACEIVGSILHQYEKKYSKELALALASGIKLDTDTFKRNTTENTYNTYGVFKQNGVTDEDIRKIFRRDFESDKLVMNLVFNNGNAKEFTNLLKNHNVSIVLNRSNPGQLYKPEMISQAADLRQDYDDVDASIVLGYTTESDDSKNVKISIRTNGYVDGGKLMKSFAKGKDNKSGGGSIISAAAIVKNSDLLEEEQKLIEFLDSVKTDDYKVKTKIKK